MVENRKSHYDNLVIGFGKGGKTLAAWLAKHGEEVAVVERSDKMYGGACINIACIPTKSLIKNAEKGLPYATAFGKKNELTSLLRGVNYSALDQLEFATVITAEASFLSANEVQIKGEDNQTMRIHANRIFINTGSQPFIPSIEGIRESKRVFTSTSLLDQSVLVKKLIILGGGFIGLEFADMYAKFGAEVTIVERGDTFLPKEDDDVAQEIHKLLTAKGIRILTGVSVEKIVDLDTDGVRLDYKSKDGQPMSLEGSAILLATGRKPNTEDLNLQASGVETNEKGYIQVNEFLKTNIPSIWAIGDCNGGPQFTYISLDDFRIIRDQLSGGEYTSVAQREKIASTVFITPPLAHIGLREKEAKDQGYAYKVAKLPVTSVPRARIDGQTDGFLKTLIDTKTNKIIGCTLLCVNAGEMINTIQVAINAGLDFQKIRDTVFTHPSMTEAFNDLYSQI